MYVIRGFICGMLVYLMRNGNWSTDVTQARRCNAEMAAVLEQEFHKIGAEAVLESDV